MEYKEYKIIIDERQKCDDPLVERMANSILHRSIIKTHYKINSQPERLNPEDADTSVCDSLISDNK